MHLDMGVVPSPRLGVKQQLIPHVLLLLYYLWKVSYSKRVILDKKRTCDAISRLSIT